MSRLHADLVEVRTSPAPAGPVPEQFLWRGRRYLVREVLARWTQSGSWWRGTAVHDLVSGAATTTTAVDDREQQWWRVEADSGRAAAVFDGGQVAAGTYDLCFEESSCSWSLKRVLD